MSTQPKMNASTLSDEELQDLFEESFRTQVADVSSIGEFECKCTRVVNKSDIRMEVTISGFAGTPTMEEFKTGKVKAANRVSINREDKGVLNFRLVPEETVSLNSNDYVIVYRA